MTTKSELMQIESNKIEAVNDLLTQAIEIMNDFDCSNFSENVKRDFKDFKVSLDSILDAGLNLHEDAEDGIDDAKDQEESARMGFTE